MERKYILTERATRIFFRILVGSVVTFMVAFLLFGIWFFFTQKANKITKLELQGEVEQVYQKDTHDPTWWVVILKGSDKEITLEKAMRHNIHPGDSLFKKGGEDFYLLNNNGTGIIKKYWITQ